MMNRAKTAEQDIFGSRGKETYAFRVTIAWPKLLEIAGRGDDRWRGSSVPPPLLRRTGFPLSRGMDLPATRCCGRGRATDPAAAAARAYK